MHRSHPPPPPESRSARGRDTGAPQGKNQNVYRHLRQLLRRGQVRIITDDITAKSLAVEAGVGLRLACVPPKPDGVAMAVGRIGAESVLAFRFYGWVAPSDNGWIGMIGSADAVNRIAEAVARAIFVAGTVRDSLTGEHN
jgi:hypothetical protein